MAVSYQWAAPEQESKYEVVAESQESVACVTARQLPEEEDGVLYDHRRNTSCVNQSVDRVVTTMHLDGEGSANNSALQMVSFFSNEGEEDHVKKDLILAVS